MSIRKNADSVFQANLGTPELASEYLNEILRLDDVETKEVFLLALKKVAQTVGMTAVAEKANLGRESLYKALSDSRDPKFSTVLSVLNAVGLEMRVEASISSVIEYTTYIDSLMVPTPVQRLEADFDWLQETDQLALAWGAQTQPHSDVGQQNQSGNLEEPLAA